MYDFLHTTGLLRPQKNIKKPKKKFEGQTQSPKLGFVDTFFFCSSNINKCEYNYPIGEIEWKYHKQLFQVQKGVYQVVKFNNSKK